MNDSERDAYVHAALALHGYPADAERAARIAAQFALIARNAAPCLAVPLVPSDEPAAILRLA